jgi:hypothetical protein
MSAAQTKRTPKTKMKSVARGGSKKRFRQATELPCNPTLTVLPVAGRKGVLLTIINHYANILEI